MINDTQTKNTLKRLGNTKWFRVFAAGAIITGLLIADKSFADDETDNQQAFKDRAALAVDRYEDQINLGFTHKEAIRTCESVLNGYLRYMLNELPTESTEYHRTVNGVLVKALYSPVNGKAFCN